MDQLEREVREMLKDKAAGMPEEYEASSEFVGHVARRRTTKLVGLSVACIVAVGGVVGALANAQGKNAAPVETVTTVPKSAVIPTRSCAAISATSEGNGTSNNLTGELPSEGTGIDPQAAAKLGMYSARSTPPAQWSSVLGPRGYTCRLEVAGDGQQTVVVAPSLGAPFTDPKIPYVSVFRDYLGHGASSDVQCRTFGGLPELFGLLAPRSGECDPGLVPTVISPGVVRWKGTASKVAGVGILEPCPAGGGCAPPRLMFDVVTCALGAEAALCDAILDDFIARNPGALPTRRVVTSAGQVGTLQLGTSTRSDVEAAYGVAEATAQGQFPYTNPKYEAFGYRCETNTNGSSGFTVVDGRTCATVFYLNVDSGTFAAFITTDPTFSTEKGSRVGMTEAEAAAKEGHHSADGCESSMDLSPSDHSMTLLVTVGLQPTDVIKSIHGQWTANSVGAFLC